MTNPNVMDCDVWRAIPHFAIKFPADTTLDSKSSDYFSFLFLSSKNTQTLKILFNFIISFLCMSICYCLCYIVTRYNNMVNGRYQIGNGKNV